MSELFINKAKAVAVTGHRRLYDDYNKKDVIQTFSSLIEIGYDTFLVGMAVGFDTECFHVLEELRKEFSIKIIECIPCRCQDETFIVSQKREYRRMIEVADEKIVLQEEYDKKCMLKRNMFMVDNCSTLVAYMRKESGGTAFTVNYARKKNVYVLNI